MKDVTKGYTTDHFQLFGSQYPSSMWYNKLYLDIIAVIASHTASEEGFIPHRGGMTWDITS